MKAKTIDPSVLASVEQVYTDGGVKGANPSEFGGSWAFVYVRQNTVIHEDSGIVLPSDVGLPTVSNNVTELVAVLLALEQLPDHWGGAVFTDSLVTLRRFESMTAKVNGVPGFLVDRVRAVVARLDYALNLLGGHPTKDDLNRGHRLKNNGSPGLPVSQFNVMVDKMCGEALRRI